MKKIFLALTALVTLGLVSCNEKSYINGPGEYNPQMPDTISYVVPDTNGIEISVDSAIALCKSLQKDAVTVEKYKLTGVVTKNTTTPISVPGSYTNINFSLSDNGGKTSISCYYTNNINNRPFGNSNQVPRVGSKITVLGPLTNYNGTTPEMKEGFIIRIDSMVAPPPFPGCPEPAEGEISVSEAVKIAFALQKSDKNNKYPSQEAYNIMGVVTEVLEFSQSNGNATYIISDGKAYFEVYRGKGKNNANLTNANQVLPNDTVTINAKVMNFNGLPETSGNAPIVKSTNPNL